MGLLKVGVAAAKTVLADQWREYFYCKSLDTEILVKKGEKKNTTGNNKGQDNIISNGAIIAVNEGQCMMIVDQGKIMEVSAEAGEFVYDSSSEPSVFYGSLGENIKKTFQTMWTRFTMGGEVPKDLRIYFFNTKEIIDNKYGTDSPVPFRIIDRNIGLDLDTSVRCHGTYSFKLVDPLLFYVNVCANVEDEYKTSQITGMMKDEVVTNLQPALAEMSAQGIRYSEIPAHAGNLRDIMNKLMSDKWMGLRGISVVSFNISPLTISAEELKTIQELQKNAVLTNPTMAAATLASAQAEAMKTAAGNTNGAMVGFAGMNLGMNAGGMNPQQMFGAVGQQNGGVNPQQLFGMGQQAGGTNAAMAAGAVGMAAQSAGWTCVSCGRTGNTGKFCMECGKPQPEVGWTCSACGKTGNLGKFCSECGGPKPAGAKVYKCDKCGWEPEDKSTPPKFCPNCGDVFDDNDEVK